MNETNNLRWPVAFLVKKHLLEAFVKWMEEEHIPQIHATGFFEKRYQKILEERLMDEPHVVQYTHTPLSLQDWGRYNATSRPGLKEEFVEKWGKEIEAKNISMISLCGFIEIIETETT